MGKGRRRWGAGVGADATLGGVGASEGGGPVRGGGGLEPAFVVVVGAAGGDPRVWCVGINEAYRQFLAGLGVRTPMVGPRPEAPVRPEFVVEALAGAERVATSGVSLRYGVGLEGGDGRVDFEVTLEPLLDGDGGCSQVLGRVVGMARDRLGRVEAARLDVGERRFAALVEHSSDVIAVLDAEGRIVYGSPSVTRVLGWPSMTLGSRRDGRRAVSVFDLVHPGDREGIRRAFVEGVATGRGWDRTEFRLRCADGSWRWVEAEATNRLADPAVGGIVVNARDVSERKAAEHALRANQEEFRSLVQASSDVITVLEPDGSLRWSSPAGARLLGYPLDGDATGWDLSLVHPDDAESARRAVVEVAAGRRTHREPIRVRVRAGWQLASL